MQALFGPAWFFPTFVWLFALGFLILILALKPSRIVKIGAYVFSGLCVLLGIGAIVDERQATKNVAAYEHCRAKNGADCGRFLGMQVIIGKPTDGLGTK